MFLHRNAKLAFLFFRVPAHMYKMCVPAFLKRGSAGTRNQERAPISVSRYYCKIVLRLKINPKEKEKKILKTQLCWRFDTFKSIFSVFKTIFG